MMKNKIICCLCILMLALSALSVQAVEPDGSMDEAISREQEEQQFEMEKEIDPQVNQLDEDIDAVKSPEANLPLKQPYSKKKLVKKFLAAMFAVAGSSLFLYFALTLYNKMMGYSGVKTYSPDKFSELKAADNISEAVKTFLNKTKWE